MATKAKANAPAAEDIARSYFDAFIARDPDAMAGHWHPDGVEDIVAIGVLRGPDEIRGFFRDLLAAIPDVETTVEAMTADERVACVRWRLAGTFDGAPFQGIDPTGRRIELRGCDWLEVEGGKIVRNTVYYDGMGFARAVGMLPPADSAGERAIKAAFNGLTRLRRSLRDLGSR